MKTLAGIMMLVGFVWGYGTVSTLDYDYAIHTTHSWLWILVNGGIASLLMFTGAELYKRN